MNKIYILINKLSCELSVLFLSLFFKLVYLNQLILGIKCFKKLNKIISIDRLKN